MHPIKGRVPGAEPHTAPGHGAVDILAPRLARSVLFAAVTGYLLVTALDLLSAHLKAPLLVIGFCCLAGVAVLQYLHSRPVSAGRRYAPVTLVLQVALTFLPLLAFHAEWGAMGGFLAGSLLLLLPPLVAWPLYGLTGLSMLVEPMTEGRSLLDSVYLCESTLITGLVVFGLTRLADLVVHLQSTRGELARLAVANERLRVSRDLHDLLGYSLSAITLKSELLLRLLAQHPQRAEREVADILTLSRQSLADVRKISRGYRDMSLAQEVSSACSMLRAADIGVEADCRAGRLSPETDTVLATVLREGITNVLRHSRVGNCTIEARREGETVVLLIANDGVVPGHRDLSPDSGSGLGNLALRVNAIGGRLVAGTTDRGWFELRAEVPLEPAQHPQPSDGTIMRVPAK